MIEMIKKMRRAEAKEFLLSLVSANQISFCLNVTSFLIWKYLQMCKQERVLLLRYLLHF